MKSQTCLFLIFFVLSSCGSSEEQLARKADRIHAMIMTVDTHCDTPMELAESNYDLGVRHEEGCVDFPRMNSGGLHAEFFAVYLAQGPLNDSAYIEMHQTTLAILDSIHRNVNRNSAMAGIAVTVDDGYRLKKDRKIAAYIGIENGYAIGKDISRIKEYYDQGARYMTLSHVRNNDICDSSTDPAGPVNNGLSEFGVQVVKEMNRLGMMVDVSHISDKAFYDVLKITSVPVIASHSSCRALCGSPRNLSDDMLLALKENGGVIQICTVSSYLKTPEPNPEMDARIEDLKKKYGDYNLLSDSIKKIVRKEYGEIREKYEKLATVKDIVDHIDHVVQVIGVDYVGIGSDFDGGGGVQGCRNAGEMKNITIELLRRGYRKEDIRKIWGGNLMRVFRKAEMAASSSGQSS